MVTLKCLIGVSGPIRSGQVPDLIGRSGQSGQVNLTCRRDTDILYMNTLCICHAFVYVYVKLAFKGHV